MVGFADHRVKLKENEKKDEYLDVARELKKNVEHKSDVYTNSLHTVTTGLAQVLEDLEIRGRVETIQTTVFLRLSRILRRVLET